MHEVVDWSLCGLSFLFLLSGGIFCFSPSPGRFRRSLLGSVFFLLAFHVVLVILKDTNLLLKYVFVFRAVTPFSYLIPPLLYIYARSFYTKEHFFRKTDWPHLILFMVALVDVMSYMFFTPLAVKRKAVMMIMTDESAIVSVAAGFLPPVTHYLLLIIIWPVYAFAHCRKVWQGWAGWHYGGNGASYKMAMVAAFDAALCAGNVIGRSYLVLHQFKLTAGTKFIINDVIVFLIISSLCFCFYLFARPEYLYGTFDSGSPEDGGDAMPASDVPVPVKENDAPEPLRSSGVKNSDAASSRELIERLENYMEDTQAYKRKGIRIGDVAAELGVNHYLLSQAINSHFCQRFTDYINEKRIACIKQQIIEGGGWQKFSIEGLAADSGFSSRTPFYAAFRKVTGLTPSEYIEQVKEEKSVDV